MTCYSLGDPHASTRFRALRGVRVKVGVRSGLGWVACAKRRLPDRNL